MIHKFRLFETDVTVDVDHQTNAEGRSIITTFIYPAEELSNLIERSNRLTSFVNDILTQVSRDVSSYSNVAFKIKDNINTRSIERLLSDFEKSIISSREIENDDESTMSLEVEYRPYIIATLNVSDKAEKFINSRYYLYAIKVPFPKWIKNLEKEDVTDDAQSVDVYAESGDSES